MSLRQKTNFGLTWSALEKIANQGLAFFIQILLARLVAPSEFGLLALVAIFIAFCNVIIDAGFGQAIIQKKEVSRDDVSTVFIVNLVISVSMYGVAFFAAPAIADFYNEPRLTLLLRVLAISFVIRGIGIIQNSLLIRNLEFQKLFKVATPAILIAGVVGVAMAFLGFEVWALVAYQMVNATMLTICYWLFSDRDMWPSWQFSFSSFRSLGRFGFGMLGAVLFTQTVQKMYGLVIAKQFNFAQLGFYNRARAFHQAPSQGLSQVLNRVLFPVFSTIQDDNRRIVSAIRNGMPLLAFLLFPAMAFLMVAAEQIVVVLLTKKWLPAAELMNWFPVIGMTYPIVAIQLSAIRAKGRSGVYFWFTVVKNVLAIVTLVLTVNHGVLAVVMGQVAVAVVNYLFINLPACHVIIGYKAREQFEDILPSLLCVVGAGISCWFLASFANWNSHLAMLLLKAFVFFVSYIGLAACFRLRGLQFTSDKLRGALGGLDKLATFRVKR